MGRKNLEKVSIEVSVEQGIDQRVADDLAQMYQRILINGVDLNQEMRGVGKAVIGTDGGCATRFQTGLAHPQPPPVRDQGNSHQPSNAQQVGNHTAYCFDCEHWALFGL